MLWTTCPACRRGSAAGSEPLLVPRGVSPPVAKEGAPARHGGWSGGVSEKEGQLRTPKQGGAVACVGACAVDSASAPG